MQLPFRAVIYQRAITIPYRSAVRYHQFTAAAAAAAAAVGVVG